MASPKKVWRTGPKGTLSTEAGGLKLSIQQSSTPGYYRFMVAQGASNAPASPGTLASGNRRSALHAMAAAEQAAAIIGQWSMTVDPSTLIRDLAVAMERPVAELTGPTESEADGASSR